VTVPDFGEKTCRIHEEPVLADRLLIKEKPTTNKGLTKEVGGESRDPREDGEAGTGLQDEKSDGLLGEQTHNDGGPVEG
jgi:hypothetical protein